MRPGSQHCQKETPEFIRDITESLKKIMPGQKALFGNNDHSIIIKRNLRLESEEWRLEEAKKDWKDVVCIACKILSIFAISTID
jgi:hypothetical protein